VSDPLTSLTAALAGRYRIDRELGRGGMATVYLAHDVRHDRHVALKVLRPELAAVIGADRFLQEIRVTANLQHPHILALFDSGKSDGFLYYVMPYVDGESLRARLSREKQLPIDEAITIARAVASALDYAHRHGVIHRDIKPENILLHDGQPVVADFGIALAVSSAGGSRLTETGLSLGTPHYMSPEQATGDRDLDGRTDIYSLAAVLYEMLTGDPPHTGATVQAVIAKLVTEEPRSLVAQRSTVPLPVDRAVRKALAKLPADRFATAAQLAGALVGTDVTDGERAAVPTPLRSVSNAVRRWLHRNRALAATAGVAVVAIVAAVSGWLRPVGTVTPRSVVWFRIPVPPEEQYSTALGTNLALSPDGRTLAFVSLGLNDRAILVRSVDQLGVRPLAGTSSAQRPFVSPDGEWVGFVSSDGRLRRVPVSGGPPQAISPVGGVGDVSWGDREVIVFSSLTDPGLFRVSSQGGEPARIATPDTARGETAYRHPHVLPGSQAAVFTVWSRSVADAQLAVIDIETGAITRLGLAGTDATYVPPGLLFFGSAGGSLYAVSFDPERRAVLGEPRPVLDDIIIQGSGAIELALSPSGTLAYLSGSAMGRLVIVDSNGAVTPVRAEDRTYSSPRFSPTGSSLAMDISDGVGTDIWIHRFDTGAMSRLTFVGENIRPAWSPDGGRIAYSTTRDGRRSVYASAADGSGEAERLVGTENEIWEAIWANDGHGLVIRQNHPSSGRDLWSVALDDDRALSPILTTEFSEDAPALSPDGRWLAYASNATGQTEVYVRPMTGGGQWQISTGGGSEPVWSPRADRLYYRSGNALVAAQVRTATTFVLERRDTVLIGRYRALGVHANYDVHPDGRRFAMVAPSEEGSELVMVVNWVEAIAQSMSR